MYRYLFYICELQMRKIAKSKWIQVGLNTPLINFSRIQKDSSYTVAGDTLLI